MKLWCVAKLKGEKTPVHIVNASRERRFIGNHFTFSKVDAEALLVVMRDAYPQCVYELLDIDWEEDKNGRAY